MKNLPRWLVGVSLSMFLIGAFFLSLSPILPDIAEGFDAPLRAYGYPGAGYSLALGISAIVLSSLQDVFERRRLLALGIGMHAGGILITALASSWMLVVVGYVLCGVGVGLFQPAAYGLAVELTDSRHTARNLGRINVGWAAATLVGVPLAGSYAALVGWRLSAGSFLLIWAIVVLFIWKVARKSTYHSVGAERNRHWSRKTLKQMAGERLHWLYIATVLIFIGFYGVYIYLGLEIRNRLGSNSLVAGGFVFFYGLGFLAGSLLTSRIDKLGYRNTLVYACLVLGLTLMCIPVATSLPVLLAILMFVWGIHQVAAFTSITALAGSVGTSIKGRALSIKSSMVMFGASMGIFLMGYVNAEIGFKSVGIACALASFAAAAVVGLRLKEIAE